MKIKFSFVRMGANPRMRATLIDGIQQSDVNDSFRLLVLRALRGAWLTGNELYVIQQFTQAINDSTDGLMVIDIKTITATNKYVIID